MKLVFCLTVAATMYAQPATLVYKTNSDRDLKIGLTYPAGWKQTDHRAAVVFFYNGGWGTGNPEKQFDEQALYFNERAR
jgi:hypothetical protein